MPRLAPQPGHRRAMRMPPAPTIDAGSGTGQTATTDTPTLNCPIGEGFIGMSAQAYVNGLPSGNAVAITAAHRAARSVPVVTASLADDTLFTVQVRYGGGLRSRVLPLLTNIP